MNSLPTNNSSQDASIECTQAFKVWADYVALAVDPASTVSTRQAAASTALQLISAPSDTSLSVGPGDLAFIEGGKRNWFAHRYGNDMPLLAAFFEEGGDRWTPKERPDAIRAARCSNATIISGKTDSSGSQ